MASESYLPAGTRLCIRDAAGKAGWYTTKKEIPIGSELRTAACPLTGRTVRTLKTDGYDVFFTAAQVNNRRVAETAETRNLNACMLIYDIPDTADVPNPSRVLRRLGVRVNLSCWVIPESDVPYTTLHALTEGGATWHTVRFDASEARKLVDMAVAALRRELADAVARAEASRDGADAQLAASSDDPDRAEAYYLRRAASIAERCRELQDDLAAVAGRFGIDPEQFGAAAAETAVAAISAGMHARAAEYAAAVKAAKAAGMGDVDGVPAAVMQDVLRDAAYGGGNPLEPGDADALLARGKRLTAVFGDGDEYSLADRFDGE